jgi:hypothetical protein
MANENEKPVPGKRRLIVEVKMISVDFVPTWYVMEGDKVVSAKSTAIGQKALDFDALPSELQKQLIQITEMVWTTHLRNSPRHRETIKRLLDGKQADRDSLGGYID